MSKTIHRSCPVCTRDNRDSKPSNYSRNEWKIKECPECKFVYLENAPVYEALVKEFAWEKTSRKEKTARKTREPVKQSLSDYFKMVRKRYLKRSKLTKLINRYFDLGNVLDIGCASGGVLRKLDSGYVPFGIEISEYLAQKGNESIRRKGGYILHCDALSGLSQFEDDFFEGIVMSAFLEHEAEPIGLLNECFRALKDHGKVIIKVPNYACVNRMARGSKWCGFRYPDHVNYFTPATLRNMCEELGFVVHKFDFFDRHPFSDNMWMVIIKNNSG